MAVRSPVSVICYQRHPVPERHTHSREMRESSRIHLAVGEDCETGNVELGITQKQSGKRRNEISNGGLTSFPSIKWG